MSITADDWSKSETLAREFLKAERKATDPIQVVRFEELPFLMSAQWFDGHENVLVFAGRVQAARGVSALPAYFEFLGEAGLRALPPGTLAGLLDMFDAGEPKASLGRLWGRGAKTNEDLYPAIAENNGTLKYVVHYIEAGARSPIPGGSRPPGNLVLERWSLQLYPVVSDLAWKREERIERPAPPPPPLQ